jgi:hypothetical protein
MATSTLSLCFGSGAFAGKTGGGAKVTGADVGWAARDGMPLTEQASEATSKIEIKSRTRFMVPS